jgi:hypothetical protein
LLRRGGCGYPVRARSSVHATLAPGVEASPSPVYGAALLMRFGLTAHRGFKSLRLRHTKNDPDTLLVGVVLRVTGHVGVREERASDGPSADTEQTPQRATSTT